MIYDKRKLLVPSDFLLSPEAEPMRRAAEAMYPAWLREKVRRGETPDPKPVPILDEDFMTSREGRWARIIVEAGYTEHVMRRERVDNTVIFFGSARIPDPEKEKGRKKNPLARYYADARSLAERLTRWSLSVGGERPQPFVVVTGGGPAIMEAGNRGAKDAGGKTIGLNITLPMEQHPNPYISPELNFHFHYFFTRKFHFTYRAKAVVAFPGGFGTFDELFEFLTLVQTRKVTKPVCTLLYGTEFWTRAVNLPYLAESGVISPEDLDLFRVVDDVDEAFGILTSHLKPFIDEPAGDGNGEG